MMGMIAIYAKYGLSVALIERFFFLFLLVCLAYIDLDTYFLPYGLLLALFALGVVFNSIYVMSPSLYVSPSGVNGLLGYFIFDESTSFSLTNKILGALIGFFSLVGMNLLMTYVLRKSSRLKKDQWAMGFGDPLLLCAIGLFVGIEHLLLTIFLAASVGSVVGILLTFKTPSRCADVPSGAVPFGPFLAIAAIYVYLL
jgi:leader peptidase (prepilin peptidase)/N-methyltransferase